MNGKCGMRVFTKTDRISSGVKSSALARLNWVSLSLSLHWGSFTGSGGTSFFQICPILFPFYLRGTATINQKPVCG